MHVDKLRIARDDIGLVPAGQYFKRVATALREANERESVPRLRSGESEDRIRDRVRNSVQ